MQTTNTAIAGVDFDAEFFEPSEGSPKVRVLVLGGSDGGIPSRRAQLLAENGFPALALGYFKTARTPEYLDMIPLEYFERPLQWLKESSPAPDSKIAVVGESKGAELALLLASITPTISGVVALVPSAVVFQGIPKEYWPPRSSWTRKGEQIPFVPYDLGNLPDPTNVLSIYRNSLKQTEATRQAAIAVDRIQGPILLLSAKQDEMWPSVEMSETIMRTLADKGFKYPREHIAYDQAGHTLTEYFMMGGTEDGNRQARLDSTQRTVSFLNQLATG